MLAAGRVLALWRHALGFAVAVAVVASVYLYYRAEYAHAKRLRIVADGKFYRSGQLTAVVKGIADQRGFGFADTEHL